MHQRRRRPRFMMTAHPLSRLRTRFLLVLHGCWTHTVVVFTPTPQEGGEEMNDSGSRRRRGVLAASGASEGTQLQHSFWSSCLVRKIPIRASPCLCLAGPVCGMGEESLG